MTHRLIVTLCAAISLASGGAAFAQQQPGETSGPAAGKDVEPTTVIQKKHEGRSSAGDEDTRPAAGMPDVEGERGTQSGQAPLDDDEYPDD